jgi:DNA-binding XRE family transcriptional regulator
MTTKRKPGRPAAKPNALLLTALDKRHMTQAALAREVGVTKQAANYWCETGVPLTRVHDVAAVLKCSLKALRPDVFR